MKLFDAELIGSVPLSKSVPPQPLIAEHAHVLQVQVTPGSMTPTVARALAALLVTAAAESEKITKVMITR